MDNIAEAQFNGLLDGVLNSDTRPFAGRESRMVIHPAGATFTCSVLDAYDRPIYLLVNEAHTVVILRAPILKNVKVSEHEAVRSYLETYVADLTFEMEPRQTLVGSMVVTMEEFTAQATPLLTGFCNRVREAALAIKEHRAGRLRDPQRLELTT